MDFTERTRNVWERCEDWYDKHSHGRMPKVDPTGPVTGSYRVLRGGSWKDSAWGCRSACRNFSSPVPVIRVDDYGFRLVVSSSRTS